MDTDLTLRKYLIFCLAYLVAVGLLMSSPWFGADAVEILWQVSFFLILTPLRKVMHWRYLSLWLVGFAAAGGAVALHWHGVQTAVLFLFDPRLTASSATAALIAMLLMYGAIWFAIQAAWNRDASSTTLPH